MFYLADKFQTWTKLQNGNFIPLFFSGLSHNKVIKVNRFLLSRKLRFALEKKKNLIISAANIYFLRHEKSFLYQLQNPRNAHEMHQELYNIWWDFLVQIVFFTISKQFEPKNNAKCQERN